MADLRTYVITVGMGEDRNGDPIPASKRALNVQDAARLLLIQPDIGGYTIQQGHGGWLNDKGHVVAEPVSIFTVGVENGQDVEGREFDGSPVRFIHRLEHMRFLARRIGELFNQECTCLEYRVTGQFFIVPTADEE